MTDCIFCKIANGTIAAKKILETDTVVAFMDIAPQAPVHALVVPKSHIRNITELSAHPANVTTDVVAAINSVAKECGISESGFRVVTNTGDNGGQTVDHLHFHVLGGRSMTWPPG